MKIVIIAITALTLFQLNARSSHAGHLGLHADAGLMALTNSLEQGGQGPAGSSILTQLNAFWNFEWVGVGFFLQYDKQGSSETDFLLGPKMEFHYGPLFLDAGYALIMSRAYTDRAIANQGGTGAYFGLGVRIHLTKLVDEPGLYFQVSYRFRNLSVTEQDGAELSEPILQTDSYPLFSVGYAL